MPDNKYKMYNTLEFHSFGVKMLLTFNKSRPPASEYNVLVSRKILWVVWKFLNWFVLFLQYLNKNGITDISIENFSFSTKLHIGEFLECKEVCVVNGQFCYYEVARQAWQCNSM